MKHFKLNRLAAKSKAALPGKLLLGGLLHAGLFGVVLAATATSTQQNDAPTPEPQAGPLALSGSVAVGAEHNSNLSVSEIENSSGQSDVAGTLELNLNASWQPNEKFRAEGAYSFTSRRYQDLSSYDLDLHLLSADVSYDFSLLTLGSSYYHANANLGGDSFLTLNQYSLYAGKLFNQQWYLRGALTTARKNFEVLDARDADNDGFSIDLYRFFNDGKSSVTVGYGYEDEKTNDASFRYKADTLRVRLNHRFTLASHDARWQLGYRIQDRDYAYNTPSIGVPRDDSQQVADARLEVNVAKNFAVIGHFEHGNYDSRLPSANFSDNRISLAAQYSF